MILLGKVSAGCSKPLENGGLISPKGLVLGRTPGTRKGVFGETEGALKGLRRSESEDTKKPLSCRERFRLKRRFERRKRDQSAPIDGGMSRDERHGAS